MCGDAVGRVWSERTNRPGRRTGIEHSTKLKWEGRWDQLEGRVKQTWGDMTDDDLDVAEGNWDESVGTIKERTGEEEAEIERRLDFEVWP